MKAIKILAISFVVAMFGACTPIDIDMFSTVCGTVLDADTTSPIEGVSVILSPTGKNAITGTDGYFEFSNLEALQYTVTVQKTGYSTNRKTINAIAGEVNQFTITMRKN